MVLSLPLVSHFYHTHLPLFTALEKIDLDTACPSLWADRIFYLVFPFNPNPYLSITPQAHTFTYA